ncbi:MAG: hypothetical protein RBS07_11050 [Lentimicrobium sp.]|jgi:hypothetical protein|nr:hypothetical protein [Lentimicrobium sp.]
MKKEVIASFYRYMKRKGAEQIKMMNDPDNVSGAPQAPAHLAQLNPDLTAKINGVEYIYKYVEGNKEDQKNLLKTCQTYSQLNKKYPFKFRLLVPVDHSDAVLQTLNQNHLESVGIVRVSTGNT